MSREPELDLPESGVPEEEQPNEALGGGGEVRNVEMPDLLLDSGPVKPKRGRPRKDRSAAEAPGGALQEAPKAGADAEDFHINILWETCPLEHGELVLKQLREELDYGAKILQKRVNADADVVVLCSNPDCKRPIRGGAWVARHTHREKGTGIEYTVTSCSERCYIINQRRIQRPAQEHHKSGGLVRG